MALVLEEAWTLGTALATSVLGQGSALPSSRPSVPINVDISIFIIYTLILLCINWSLRIFVVKPLVTAALGHPRTDKIVIKFCQSCMECFVYGSFTVLGLIVVPSQPWVWPSSEWWRGFADSGAPHALMRNDLRAYYILYAARYAQGAVSVLLEPKRKDFIEMMLHHIVTVVLTGLSYECGWNRVGVVVMLLLDPADVPLHLAKGCKYMRESGQATSVPWSFMADRLFEVFAVIFFVMRLVAYPYVCWSAHIEATRYWPKGLPEWACVAMLELLFLLQVYWFSLIVKVAVKLIRDGKVDDVRSDDEEEDKKEQ